MNWKTIFNPFIKFDEKILFVAGIMTITTVFIISYYLGFQIDSLFHFRYIKPEDSLVQIILSTLIVYAVSISILFLYGKIINKRTRLIDIMTPVFVSQLPVILLIIFNQIPFIKGAENEILASVDNKSSNINPLSIVIITAYSFISLAIAAYGIAILFNGFRTATNMKKWQHIVIFSILLLTMMITMQFL